MSTEHAERALIGCIIANPKAFELVPDVEPCHFAMFEHVIVYGEMHRELVAGRKLDFAILLNLLQVKNLIDKAGGYPYLNELATCACSPQNAIRYAEIILSNFRRYELKNAFLDGIAQLDSNTDPMDVGGQILDTVGKISDNRSADTLRTVDQLLGGHVEMMQKRHAGEEKFTQTGLEDLDKKLGGGFSDGDLVVLAARPAMGKTAMALTISLNVSEHSPVLFFSMEMSSDQLVDRAIANLGMVDLSWIRKPDDDGSSWERHTFGFQKLQSRNLIVDDRAGRKLIDIQAIAKRVNRTSKLGLIVVDYLGLMRGGNSTNRNLELGDYTKGLKQLAKDLGCPVVLLAQLNRKVDDRAKKEPVMSDLRDSGEIEADADTVMFLYRDEYYNPDSMNKGVGEVIVAKQRQGTTGIVPVAFMGAYQRFDNLASTYHRDEPAPRSQSRRRGVD